MDVLNQQLSTFFKSLGIEIASPPFVITAVIVVFAVLWFLLRGLRLWYWKTNQQLDTLKRIDDRLKNIEQYGGVPAASGIERNDELETPEVENDPAVGNQPDQESGKGDASSAEVQGIIRMSMSKSGRIYTEEELDQQIKE